MILLLNNNSSHIKKFAYLYLKVRIYYKYIYINHLYKLIINLNFFKKNIIFY